MKPYWFMKKKTLYNNIIIRNRFGDFPGNFIFLLS